MPLSSYLTTLPSDVLLGPGILRIGSTNVGVTRGAVKWDPAFEVIPLPFDGRHAPVKGLDRKFHGESLLSFTLIEAGDSATGNQIAKYEAGSTSASAGTPNVTTITPKSGGVLYASGDYLTDVRLIFERGIGTGTKLYYCVYMACALVRKYTMADNGTKDVASFDVEICGRKDMASGSINDPTYKIELREALP